RGFTMRGVGLLLLACFLWVGSGALAQGDEAPSPEQLLRDGNQAFERGAFELAAEGWTNAAAGYERIGDRQAQSETLVRLAEAYQALGQHRLGLQALQAADHLIGEDAKPVLPQGDRKSTRLNSSHDQISYAVFCLKKKNKKNNIKSSYPTSTTTHIQ